MKLKHGIKYIDDIKQLKRLRFKDKKAYESFFKTVMKEHNVSQRSLYRHMNMKMPGLRKIRKDTGKLKSRMALRAKTIMSEAIESGMRKQEAIKLAESMTGKKISARVSTRTKPVPVKQTNFGGDMKEFLEKICNYDLIAPDAGMKLKLKSVSFTVNKEDVGDVILILTNAYNREAENKGTDKIPLDKNELFKKKIFQLLEYNIKLAEESADLRSLESITRMYNSIQDEHDLGADFEIVYKICSSLKPGISRPELISLIKQNSK